MMRLDAYVRIDGSNRRLRARLNAAPYTTVDLTDGLYAPIDLVAHIQTKLQVVDAAWTATMGATAVVTLAAPGKTLYIEWTHPALRDLLGWTADISGVASPSVAPSACAACFVPTLPWLDRRPLGFLLETSRTDSVRKRGRSYLRTMVRQWAVTARVKASEAARFRSVMTTLQRGSRARFYRHVDLLSTPWAFSDPHGYVDVSLNPETRDYSERWLAGGGAQLVYTVDLEFLGVP